MSSASECVAREVPRKRVRYFQVRQHDSFEAVELS